MSSSKMWSSSEDCPRSNKRRLVTPRQRDESETVLQVDRELGDLVDLLGICRQKNDDAENYAQEFLRGVVDGIRQVLQESEEVRERRIECDEGFGTSLKIDIDTEANLISLKDPAQVKKLGKKLGNSLAMLALYSED